MENTNFLARLFTDAREIVESAETPFSKLAIFILPVLSPLVPAFMTGLHMYKLLGDLFTFTYATQVSGGMAITIALVLEMLGYVGAITFIKSLFTWIKKKEDAYIMPFALNGLAYIFYLVAMWMINFQLGKYFGTPEIINNIFGLLSFITVPTGLLAANHLNEASEKEDEEKIRQEKREDKLKAKALKAGVNIFQPQTPATVLQADIPQVKEAKTKHGSDYKDKVWALLDEEWNAKKVVLSPSQITERLNKKYRTELVNGNVKGFWSRTTKDWRVSRGI